MTTELEDLKQQSILKIEEAAKNNNHLYVECLIKQLEVVGYTNTRLQHLLALSLHQLSKHDESEQILNKLIEVDSENHEVWNTLGIVYRSLDRCTDSIRCFEKSLSLNDQCSVVYNNLALSLHINGECDAAKEMLEKALTFNDGYKHISHFNYGNLLSYFKYYQHAIEQYKKAIDICPEFYTAIWNLSGAFLADGEYKNGWNAYESRWLNFPHCLHFRNQYTEGKYWQGADIEGKTIVLYNEQGAGDMVQFIRFAKMLKERGAIVIADWGNQVIRGDLVNLLNRLPFVDKVIDKLQEPIEYDFCQSVASLPRVLKIYNDSQLLPEPYISPDLESLEYNLPLWNDYANKPKIGLVWAGSCLHPNDVNRSLPLSSFKPLMERFPNVNFFSFQKDNRPRKWNTKEVNLSEGLETMPIVDLSHLLLNFNCTANLLSKMDLVVSVDTATLHIAGAMGKPAILLLPQTNPDWRWRKNENDCSVWYPTIKIIEMSNLNFIEPLLTEVESLLPACASN